MRIFKFSFAVIAISTLSLYSVTCGAAVISYSGAPDAIKTQLGTPTSNVTPIRDNFLSTLSSFGIEDVESLTSAPNPTLTFGATGITGTTGFPGGAQTFPTFAVSGSNFLLDTEGANGASSNEFINFSRIVTAFGTYITNSGDGPADSFSFLLENTITGTSKVVDFGALGPDAPQTNVRFFGVTDTDGFDRISFVETFDHDGFLYDDLIAGDVRAVPEPGSIAIVAAGIAGVLRFRRKKKLTA